MSSSLVTQSTLNPREREWLVALRAFIFKILEPIVKDEKERLLFVDAEAMMIWAQAFTHETFSRDPSQNYEGLEFRGDTLLGYVFPKYLIKRFPNLPPRIYTELHVSYMSKKPFTVGSQTDAAKTLGFDRYVRMTGLTVATPGILTDLFESFFGALDVVADRRGFGLGGVYAYNMILHLFKDIAIDAKGAVGAPKTQVEQIFIRLGLKKPNELHIANQQGEETVVVQLFPVQARFLARYSTVFRDYIAKNPPETSPPIVLGSATSTSRKDSEHNAFTQALKTLTDQGVTTEWARKIKYRSDFYDNSTLQPYMAVVNQRLEREGYEQEVFFFLPKKMVEKIEAQRGGGERRVIQLIGTRKEGQQRGGREDILVTVMSSDKSSSYQMAKALLLATYAQVPPPPGSLQTSQVITTGYPSASQLPSTSS